MFSLSNKPNRILKSLIGMVFAFINMQEVVMSDFSIEFILVAVLISLIVIVPFISYNPIPF